MAEYDTYAMSGWFVVGTSGGGKHVRYSTAAGWGTPDGVGAF